MTILTNWNMTTNKQKSFWFLIITILFISSGLLVYFTGGIKFVYSHSMYIPIVLSAILFKKKGGFMAGIAGGIILGPFMPIDTLTGEMQLTVNWLYRTTTFAFVGTFVGYAVHILQHTNEELMKKIEEQTRNDKEIKILYSEARDNERLFNHILNASPVVIYRLEAVTYTTIWISDNITRILGYTVEEALQSSWWAEHVHPEDREVVAFNLDLLTKHGCIDYTYRFLKKNGEIIWIHDRLILHTNKDGNFFEIIGAWTDITEQKKAEKNRIARLAADQANQAKSVFLSNMSHEIRTPLNAIIGFAQILKRDASIPSKQTEQVQTILRSGEHLLKLINDILDLSKIEAGHLSLKRESFSLHQLLDDLEMMFRQSARDKGLQLLFERHNNVPKYVVTDEEKLRQVLINLLGNALKFTSTGGVTLRVKYNDNKDGSLLLVEVEDSGPGISDDDKERIFDSFSQTVAGEKLGGTGLGLAISKNLIELLGGRLTLESTLEVGSIFRCFVPLILSNDAKEKQENFLDYVVGLNPDTGPYRILVADDLQDNRDVLRELLKPIGFEIKEADNGEEAFKIFEYWEPHAVLIDMHMPVMDGYEVIRRIKVMDKGRSTLVVAITASVFDSDMKKALAAGTDVFLKKPINAEELYMTMGKIPGLKYVFTNKEVQGTENPERLPLNSHDLSILPNNLILSMRLAVEQGNMTKLKEAIAQVEKINISLACGIRALAKQYDYEQLSTLFMIEGVEHNE